MVEEGEGKDAITYLCIGHVSFLPVLTFPLQHPPACLFEKNCLPLLSYSLQRSRILRAEREARNVEALSYVTHKSEQV